MNSLARTLIIAFGFSALVISLIMICIGFVLVLGGYAIWCSIGMAMAGVGFIMAASAIDIIVYGMSVKRKRRA